MNLRKVRVSVAFTLGALATLDVTSAALTAVPVNPTRLITLDASFGLSNTIAADDGHTFGVAHGDYTNAEIEECLEATNSINPGDKVTQERANRLVRYIGKFEKGAAGESGSFNDGKRIKIRLNWPMAIGQNLVIWCRNGGSNVWTSGADILIDGNLWVKDGF